DMEGEVDLRDGLTRLGPCAINPVQGVHCLSCGLDRITASLALCLRRQRKDREHTVPQEFYYLPATRTQWGGQCLEHLVEQLDDFQSRRAVGELREPPHVREPQHGVDPLERASLHRSGMNSPPGVVAEIGSEEA